MLIHADKTNENKHNSVANTMVEESDMGTVLQRMDNRPEALFYNRLQKYVNIRPNENKVDDVHQLQNEADAQDGSQTTKPADESSQNKFISDKPSETSIGKVEFLDQLRDKINKDADEVLSQVNQTAIDCPYIVKWFSYYSDKDPYHIEEAISRFAPASEGAKEIEGYMDSIVARVRSGLQNHLDTGTIKDVPPELVDTPHAPEDFLHMVNKDQAPAQLACLFGNKKEKNYEHFKKEVVRPEKRITHCLLQGQSLTAAPGDYVMNAGTTSCGLVLGFGENGIACYHWPFMTNSTEYVSTFSKVVNRVGTLHRIEIITNDIPKGSKAAYKETTDFITNNFGVTTVHYVIKGQLVGDPFGKLEENHFSSSGLEVVSWDED